MRLPMLVISLLAAVPGAAAARTATVVAPAATVSGVTVTAQYVALGGPLGGGFAAPPVDTNVLGYDWTAPFRERVGMCSKLDGVEPGDKFSIKIRISFNRDGTLMSPPHLLVPAPSAKQKALMESAVDALQRCQPFTMLPPEKYKQWETMVVYVTPLLVYR